MNERNLKCAVYHTACTEGTNFPIDTMDKWTLRNSCHPALQWHGSQRDGARIWTEICVTERGRLRGWSLSRHRDLISHSLCRMRPLIVARVRTTRMASSGRSALPIVSRLRWKSASFGTFSHGTTESGATHIGQQQYIPLDPLSAFSCNLKC